MRAVLVESDLVPGQVLGLAEEQAHHLNVVRARVNEKILILNGKGYSAIAEILTISKKSSEIKVLEVKSEERKHNISIAIGVPKKDAFEDIVKIAVEVGVQSVYPLTSNFSQYEVEASDRLNRLIESAMIQSNNLYWPEMFKQNTLESFLETFTGELVYFCSRPQLNSKQSDVAKHNNIVILIGPEGGFSEEEEAKIMAYKMVKLVHLPTPIMRAPTAVATSVGYLLSLI